MTSSKNNSSQQYKNSATTSAKGAAPVDAETARAHSQRSRTHSGWSGYPCEGNDAKQLGDHCVGEHHSSICDIHHICANNS